MRGKELKNLIIALVAILAITFLEFTAIRAGIDGILFSFVVALIAGLGGFEVDRFKRIIKK